MNTRKCCAFVLVLLLLFPVAVLAQDDATDEAMDEVQMGAWETCETPDNLPEEINLGVIYSLSGPISVYGGPQQQAVQLALEEINGSAYLGEGTTLTAIFEDSAGDAEQAINAMTKLVEEDGVVAVLGPTLSTEAFSADPIAQENGTPVMGTSNTAIGITDMGDFVFRDSLPEASVIPGTIAQSVEILGLERVGVLYGDDDDFTLSGYDVFIEALDENGIEIVGEETFSREDVDFSAQLTNLLNNDPDALIVSALSAEAVQIIIQARDLGFEGAIIGGNGFNSPDTIEQTGEASEGVIVGAAWNVASTNPYSEAYETAYEEAYGNAPDQFATQAYTGAWLFATAIRCANSAERSDIRDALAAITDLETPLGTFSFSETRDPIHDPVVQIVQDGAFAVLGAEDMEESE
ncbi:ABC transporter substrate-binding protein [Phototrophicus methaneseepsis]|uniref:ABC transporter substrate-binding protein n=1 Tax=Phototrophicus methaneseepsis TaxID=2710758 RepID=A0A7S8EBM7_9CHLR|nr:ABC transporter substrate-binding protein [Phototrophicus methaneseepsis]QPC83951.1 ABC transporter substrate-binding protein [Phototrophicus methaneseepsis]